MVHDLVQVNWKTGELRVVLNGQEPFDELRPHIVRFVLTPSERLEDLAAGLQADSSVDLTLPSTDIDSEDVYAIRITFYLGDRSIVALASNKPVPRELAVLAVRLIVGELREMHSDASEFTDLADHARWVIVRILRRRIRLIEASVREALKDDHVTAADYAALREYPVRLATVERLATLPEPQWESYRQRGLYDITPNIDHYWQSIQNVAKDAREAVARLSGLISSQQIVLTQRQAVEAERFQRLLTLVGTAVLVPGLVAAIFGANVGFSGRDGVEAFWAMVLFMVAGGLGSYALLRSLERDLWKTVGKRLGVTRLSEDRRLLFLAVLAATALAAGLFVLSRADAAATPGDRQDEAAQHRSHS